MFPDLQLERLKVEPLIDDYDSLHSLAGSLVFPRKSSFNMGISRAKGTRKSSKADDPVDEEGSTPPSPEQWKKMEVFKCFSGML